MPFILTGPYVDLACEPHVAKCGEKVDVFSDLYGRSFVAPGHCKSEKATGVDGDSQSGGRLTVHLQKGHGLDVAGYFSVTFPLVQRLTVQSSTHGGVLTCRMRRKILILF